MVEVGEVYYDEVFDSELTVVSVEPDAVVVDDLVSGDGVRELRREIDWEHNVSVGRFEKVRDEEYQQKKMDELEEEDYDSYVAMGEVELEEDDEERGVFDF